MDYAILLFLVSIGALSITQALLALGLIDVSARERAKYWREAARVAGMADVQESRRTLSGRIGALRVRFSRYGTGQTYGTRIAISGPFLPADVTVRPEGFGGSVRGWRVREIEIGDENFDRAAWVEGPPALVHSLLDADTRRMIRALFEGRLERPRRSPFWAEGRLEEGILRVDVPEVVPPTRHESSDSGAEAFCPAVGRDYVGDLTRLPEVLQAVLPLARRLATPEDLPRRLAFNLKGEPMAGVRLRALTTLLREFPDHPATREALLAAREDPDADVRLRAGVALGSEGRDVLLRIAGGEGAPDETTARAVAQLAGSLTADEAAVLLRSALRTRRLATARECIGVLGRRGGRAAVGILARLLVVKKGETAWAAARALAMTRDPAAEAALLRALAGGPRDLRLAAATALGQVGTAAAVGPLREAESGDAALRRAARQAIAEIQARAVGAAPGQLSLAGGESGRLSLAPGEPGQLSFASGSSPAGKGE